MTAYFARARRVVSVTALLAIVASALVFVGPAAEADEPLRRAVVPLDDASAFALDPANDRPVALGDGAMGTVRLSFPDSSVDETRSGTVQVFRAGEGAPADRWLGEVPVTVTVTRSGGSARFDLPAGDYVLFFDGFASTSTASGVWSWSGGGYDAAAAQSVRVADGGSLWLQMSAQQTVPASALVYDSYNLVRQADVVIYAALERNDRLELMPVGRVRSAADLDDPVSFPVLRNAQLTLVATGQGYADGWLGTAWYGVEDAASARILPGYDLRSQQLWLRVPMQLGTPLVAGTAAVGQDLVADHADAPIGPPEAGDQTWGYAFGDFSYEWFADGKPIAGEISQTLRVTGEMVGKRISFRVTAKEDGFGTTHATSLATPRVTAPVRATLRGIQWPGHTMTMSPGTWPSGTSLRYQWLMFGRPIAGATGSSLVVPYDGGTGMMIMVTASRPGYETVAAASEQDRSGLPMLYPLRVISAVAGELPAHQESGTLRGFVQGVDTSNVMLAGAQVKVYYTGTGLGPTGSTLVADVRSDENGRFSVSGLAPGSYCTVVTSSDRRFGPVDNCQQDLKWYGTRVFSGAETDASVGLSPAGRLQGTATASNGTRISGGTVSLYGWCSLPAGGMGLRKLASARTDSSGRYSFPGLETAQYFIHFAGPTSLSHQTTWWEVEPGMRSPVATARSSSGVFVESGKTTTADAMLAAYLPIGTPSVKGSLRVGGTLTASHPKTAGATYTYQWYANGKAISKATKHTFTLTKSQQGKAITVRVVAKKKSYVTTTRTSAATAKVLATTAPRILGTAKAGRPLTAAHGTWTAGTAFSYQWYGNGKPIAGATKKTYVPKASDRHHRITVKVTGRKKGYATVARTSASAGPVG